MKFWKFDFPSCTISACRRFWTKTAFYYFTPRWQHVCLSVCPRDVQSRPRLQTTHFTHYLQLKLLNGKNVRAWVSIRVVWRESSAALGRLPVLSPFLAGNWDFHLLKQKVNKHRSATELCCLHWQIWAWDFLLAYNQWKMDYSNQFFHQTS